MKDYSERSFQQVRLETTSKILPTDLLMSILNSFHCWKEVRLLFQIERLQLNEKLNNWKLEKKSEKFGSCDCSFCNLQEKKKKRTNRITMI